MSCDHDLVEAFENCVNKVYSNSCHNISHTKHANGGYASHNTFLLFMMFLEGYRYRFERHTKEQEWKIIY